MSEIQTTPKTEWSELQKLLWENAYGKGLSIEEYKRATMLINESVISEEDCWVCKMFPENKIDKVIFDTGLCLGHATYALVTQK